MRTGSILFFVLLVSFGALQCATTTTQSAGDDTVCVEEEVTGSRIPREICETPYQAKARQAEDQRDMQRFQRNTPPGPLKH
jgi:hypothetical protein